MGIFKDIKETKALYNEIDEMIEQSEIAAEKYLAMTFDEVAALSNDEFADVIHCRIFNKVETAGADSLSKEARIYFVVESYSIEHFEYDKSSICHEIFTGEEFKYASELYDAFDAVGAAPYRELLKKFMDQNGIDITALQNMKLGEQIKTLRKCKKFKGKDFDEQYEALDSRKPLDDITTAYLIANRDKLVNICV